MRTAVRCLLLLLLSACQQKPTENTTPPQPAAAQVLAAATAAPEATVAQRFSPIVSGHWVSADYLNEVARTRSPAASFDKVVSPSSLQIAPFANQKDSVEMWASYGLHEGGDMLLLLRPGTEANSLTIKLKYGGEAGTTNEIAYRLTPTDTTLFYITRKTSNNQLLSKHAYRRTGIPGKELDLETGVARGVNTILIKGQYVGVDSLNRPVRAQFLPDGVVKGLPFKKYTIQTDFAGPNPGDELIFDVYTKQQSEFAATYGRDTLRLYTVRAVVGIPPGEADTTIMFSRGRLRYQLIRTKRP